MFGPPALARCLWLASLLTGAALAACPPTFAAYSTPTWRGGAARPVLDTPFKLLFRTAIRTGAVSGDKFGDRQRLAVWGCGTGCQQAALIDTRGGRVILAPGATLDYEVHPGSRLLIASPLQPGETLADRTHLVSPPPTSWVLQAGRFVQVCRPGRF